MIHPCLPGRIALAVAFSLLASFPIRAASAAPATDLLVVLISVDGLAMEEVLVK